MKSSIENPKPAEDETRESKEISAKGLKALIAISAGALWGAAKILKATKTEKPLFFGKSKVVNPREHAEYREKGVTGIMVEKMRTVYQKIGQAEVAGLIKTDEKTNDLFLDFEGADWDKLLGGSPKK